MVAMPVFGKADMPMGREKKMSTVSRIERIADRFSDFGTHLFNGASLAALTGVVYAGRNGLAGGIFMSFARDFGTNLAVISVAVLFLVSLWGFMLVVYFAICVIVAGVEGIKAMRRKPDATPQDPRRAAHIATIAEWSADLDDVTIANICDASIDALSDGYSLLAVYQASPRPETLTVVGDIVTVEIELTVQFADRPPVTVDALLTGTVSGSSPGLTSLSRIDRTAA